MHTSRSVPWAVKAAFLLTINAVLTPANAAESCTIDIPKPLTFDQWKSEVQNRADRQIYPLIGISADDVRTALPQAVSADCDAWARIWIAIGDRYLARASVAGRDRSEADANFVSAWRYYNLARWPTLLSPAKVEAWQKAKDAFAEHGKLMDPPAETVAIPYAPGRDIVGILRKPKQSGPVPLVLTIGGLDGWRDDMTERFSGLPKNGYAVLAIDAPGTGDSPVKGDGAEADDMYAKLIDWVGAQPSFDASRIFVHGGSFGGYWASRVAILEAPRLRGAIDQSGPIDLSFNAKAINAPRVLAPSFYLSDSLPSITYMLGTRPGEETERAWIGMSLKLKGVLGKPSAPMLVIGGARDPLVPVGDLWLMMSAGARPNEAWVHPQGLHMGRVPGVWRDEEILNDVILPWLKKQTAPAAGR